MSDLDRAPDNGLVDMDFENDSDMDFESDPEVGFESDSDSHGFSEMVFPDEATLLDGAALAKDKVTQLELNLQRIGMVQIVKNFLSANWVKAILLEEVQYHGNCPYVEPKSAQFYRLIEIISNQCRSLHHPPPHQNWNQLSSLIVNKLIEIAEDMISQIFAFLEALPLNYKKFNGENRQFAFIKSYIDHIQWTSTGRIDYGATAKITLNTLEFANERLKFSELCNYCMEDDIEKWYIQRRMDGAQNCVLEWIQQIDETKIPDYDDSLDAYMMAYWHFRFERGSCRNTMAEFIRSYRHFKNFKPYCGLRHGSIDLHSLLLCLCRKHYFGINYFWSRLDEDARNYFFTELLNFVFGLSVSAIENYGPVWDIRFSLLRNMSDERCALLLDSFETIDEQSIISLFTSSWKDFTFPSLKYYIERYLYTDGRADIYFDFMQSLCYDLIDDIPLSSRKAKIREFLHGMLNSSPETFISCWNDMEFNDIDWKYHKSRDNFIFQLLRTKDLALIQALYNNEAYQKIRFDLVAETARSFPPRIRRKCKNSCGIELDSEICEQFKLEVLLNDDERKLFSLRVDNLHLLYPNGDWCIPEETDDDEDHDFHLQPESIS